MKVSIPNGEIHTCFFGEGKEVLLIIHGGPDWDHSYLINAAKQIGEFVQVILFDIRGCGASSKFDDISEYTIDNIVSDVLAVISAYGLEHCHVLGFSFGGVVAINLLKKYPKVINKLILASTNVLGNEANNIEENPEYQRRNTEELQGFISYCFSKAEIVGEEPSRSLAKRSLCLDVHDLNEIQKVERVFDEIRFSSEWLKAFRAGVIKFGELNATELIKQSGKPLLIIHGEHDLRFSVNVAVQLHRSLPHSVLNVIQNAGHLAHIEQQESWVQAIRRFINC